MKKIILLSVVLFGVLISNVQAEGLVVMPTLDIDLEDKLIIVRKRVIETASACEFDGLEFRRMIIIDREARKIIRTKVAFVDTDDPRRGLYYAEGGLEECEDDEDFSMGELYKRSWRTWRQ